MSEDVDTTSVVRRREASVTSMTSNKREAIIMPGFDDDIENDDDELAASSTDVPPRQVGDAKPPVPAKPSHLQTLKRRVENLEESSVADDVRCNENAEAHVTSTECSDTQPAVELRQQRDAELRSSDSVRSKTSVHSVASTTDTIDSGIGGSLSLDLTQRLSGLCLSIDDQAFDEYDEETKLYENQCYEGARVATDREGHHI